MGTQVVSVWVCVCVCVCVCLTRPEAESDPSQHVCLQPFTLPDYQLSARFSQVRRLEAVIHHGVVVCGADGPLDYACLLTARPTSVWQHVAKVE